MDGHPITPLTSTPDITAETPDPNVPPPSTSIPNPPRNPAEWTTSVKEFSGIRNLGRTGYLSVNLQLLFALKPFRNVRLLDDCHLEISG
jgi:ubiquitin C-terminal hydrolase